MSKNPLINAGTAMGYIVVLVLLISNGAKLFGEEDNILMPMLALSLFVLSAACMGYLFLGMPLRLYLDGEPQSAVTLFFKTLAAFAALILVLLVILFIIPRV